ncbi:MAG: efflux RND transporter periplasmic adaptor subunit [Pirellulales bacterium]
MKSTNSLSVPTDPNRDVDWQPWEKCVEQLHETARAVVGPELFYQQLLQGAVDVLAALGGAVWQRSADGELELITQINFQAQFHPHDIASGEAQRQLALIADSTTQVTSYASDGYQTDPAETHSDDAQGLPGKLSLRNPSTAMLLLCPVYFSTGESTPVPASRKPHSSGPQAVIGLFQRPDIAAAAQQGGLQFLSTLGLVAEDFETFHALRNLNVRQDQIRQVASLLQQLSGSCDLKGSAYWIANEGRRILGCDRLSVLVPRRRGWQLLAVSGADPIQTHAELSRQLCGLAERTALWGEVVDYSEIGESHSLEKLGTGSNDRGELPTELDEILQQHIDQSHARRLVAIPLSHETSQLQTQSDQDVAGSQLAGRLGHLPTAVIVAEQFSLTSCEDGSEDTHRLRQAVIDLSMLCEPAMRRALNWDRLPVQTGIQVARWSSWLTTWMGLRRAGVVMVGLLLLVAALVWIPANFDVTATAKLMPRTSSDLFAPCDGTVQKVSVTHGDKVVAGAVLAILDAPQLESDLQKIRGEIHTVFKQLEAVMVAQTERISRMQNDRSPTGLSTLPLSSQEQQLSGRLSDLRKQRQLLERRHDALTLRSPIAGQILTLDVQNLLESRPVRRGQVLFTVADTDSGWMLEAELPQDRLGYVLEATKASQTELPVRFRLVGDMKNIGCGRVEQISSTTVMPEDDLTHERAPVSVRIRVEERALPQGRPGMVAEVRIACGHRPLGYVWLHDVWEAVYRWCVF